MTTLPDEYERLKTQKDAILRRVPADVERWIAEAVERLFPANTTLPSRAAMKNKGASVALALREAFLMGRRA